MMGQILITKFKDWEYEYEDEVRLLLALEDYKKQSGLYYKKFSNDLVLKEVILGPRCTITRSDVSKLLGQDNSVVCITKARLACTKFRVVVNRKAS